MLTYKRWDNLEVIGCSDADFAEIHFKLYLYPCRRSHFIPNVRVVDSISKSLTLYYDNKVVVFYVSNNRLSVAARQIDIKYHAVNDRVQDQTIKIVHINTKSMLVDQLSKGIPPNQFKEHRAGMGVLERL
jgi:hypothetical protein